jgi:hypothetical protein
MGRKKVEVVALPLEECCNEIVRLQRERAAILKTTIMNENRLRAVVAGTLGYESKMDESSRMKKFKEASELIDKVYAGEADHTMKGFIIASNNTIESLRELLGKLEKEMVGLAGMLPVASWVSQPNQCGFGLLSLAKVVGECGNLTSYTNPGKVWRRMGCAPWEFDGPEVKYCHRKMGSTWRFGKEGKLPASEWEEFGYSPRRRSIAYQISEVLIKLNKGPYRARYVHGKATAATTHPEWDWKECEVCDATGQVSGNGVVTDLSISSICPTCGGSGKKCMRAHRHGMLLSVKLLLKNLWIEWHGHPPFEKWWENGK